MTDTDTETDREVDHPAKWSQPVLDALAGIVACAPPGPVLDPFAGVGLGRLADTLPDRSVFGVELQPEWVAASQAFPHTATIQGDATDLPADWADGFAAVVTSPCYGNRMADHHDARDACRTCDGGGSYGEPGLEVKECPDCGGSGLTHRNTYAHALRRSGGDLLPGSAAGLQWGWRYRELHAAAIGEMLRVVVPDGLLVVNMSNHVRDGAEQQVVEWWTNELLHRDCRVHEIRRIPTRRQRYGANGGLRIDGEVVIAMRTPRAED